LHVRARETPTYIWAAVAILGVALLAVPVLAVAPTPGAEASPSAVASSPAEPGASSSTEPSASSSAEPSPSAAPSPSPAADPSPGEPSPGQPSQSVSPAASPAPSPAASASAEPFGPPVPEPDAGVEPGKPDKADRQKVPEVPVTLTGSVGSTTDADGETVYTLTSGGQTFELEAGPPWWWGADHPLAPFVGRTVTVSGETRTGSDEIDVQAIGGTTIREPGKPPWAGGPWKIGERHPGWKPWKVLGEDGRPGLGRGHDGKPGRGHGREHAPGQVKKLADQAAPAPSAGPD
jgi:hypothetical protein